MKLSAILFLCVACVLAVYWVMRPSSGEHASASLDVDELDKTVKVGTTPKSSLHAAPPHQPTPGLAATESPSPLPSDGSGHTVTGNPSEEPALPFELPRIEWARTDLESFEYKPDRHPGDVLEWISELRVQAMDPAELPEKRKERVPSNGWFFRMTDGGYAVINRDFRWNRPEVDYEAEYFLLNVLSSYVYQRCKAKAISTGNFIRFESRKEMREFCNDFGYQEARHPGDRGNIALDVSELLESPEYAAIEKRLKFLKANRPRGNPPRPYRCLVQPRGMRGVKQ